MNARDALNHPVRRQILRTLIESEEPRSAGELVATALPGASVSVVSYHARVLETAGTVSRVEQSPSDETRCHYVTAVGEDPEVVALLEATRAEDLADG